MSEQALSSSGQGQIWVGVCSRERDWQGETEGKRWSGERGTGGKTRQVEGWKQRTKENKCYRVDCTHLCAKLIHLRSCLHSLCAKICIFTCPHFVSSIPICLCDQTTSLFFLLWTPASSFLHPPLSNLALPVPLCLQWEVPPSPHPSQTTFGARWTQWNSSSLLHK